MPRRITGIASVVVVAVGSTGCGEGAVTPTPDPDPAVPVVAEVAVASPIGLLVPVDWSFTLTAAVTDSGGQVLATPVSWSINDPTIATVSASGAVATVAPGGFVITASSGGRSGMIALTAVDAEMEGAAQVLDDGFADILLAEIDGAFGAGLRDAWADCAESHAIGHLEGVQACLQGVRSTAGSGPEPSDAPLHELLLLYVQVIERLSALP